MNIIILPFITMMVIMRKIYHNIIPYLEISFPRLQDEWKNQFY